MIKINETTQSKVLTWQRSHNFKEIKICGTCGHRCFEGERGWCLTMAKECGIKINDAEVNFNNSCDKWIKYIAFTVPKA
jgi:NADH pyrophosphatase NudC (nudix superfamily)